MINYRHFLIPFVHKNTRQPESFWCNWFMITVLKGTIEPTCGGKKQKPSHVDYKKNPGSKEWWWAKMQPGMCVRSDGYRKRCAQDTHERVILLGWVTLLLYITWLTNRINIANPPSSPNDSWFRLVATEGYILWPCNSYSPNRVCFLQAEGGKKRKREKEGGRKNFGSHSIEEKD